jgi:hypothetical protein
MHLVWWSFFTAPQESCTVPETLSLGHQHESNLPPQLHLLNQEDPAALQEARPDPNWERPRTGPSFIAAYLGIRDLFRAVKILLQGARYSITTIKELRYYIEVHAIVNPSM